MKAQAQPNLPHSGPISRIAESDHVYITSAGARPKLTRSESESYWTPNSVWVPAIHAIQQRGKEHRHRRLGEMAADTGDNRVETREHRSRGKQVRQQVNAAVSGRADGHGFAHEPGS